MVVFAFDPSISLRKYASFFFLNDHWFFFCEEVCAVYRKYEFSVDGGSNFNPLLFLRIVLPQCELYDKIVPYVKTLNVLPSQKKRERESIDIKNVSRAGQYNIPCGLVRYRDIKVVFVISRLEWITERQEFPRRYFIIGNKQIRKMRK